MKATDRVELVHSVDEIPASAWQVLLAESSAESVFATWEWLKAWSESLGRDRELLIALYYQQERLIGALPLENRGGAIGFAAPERRDYCDVLINLKLNVEDTLMVLGTLLKKAASVCPGFKHFDLNRVPEASPLVAAMTGGTGFHVTRRGGVPAPRMDMSTVDAMLRKKSLRRHANALARMGTVECSTFHTAADIEPLLEPFFDQHVRRWQDTPSPSLFLDPENRNFYRALTAHLGDAGSLRFSTVRLNGDLVAAHFGFMHADTFTWYKPSFEPALAKHSPGEVLIKYLLEMARDEGAEIFDFTIGDEAFKLRFATEVPQIYNLHLTDSLIAASLKRGRGALAKLVRG